MLKKILRLALFICLNNVAVADKPTSQSFNGGTVQQTFGTDSGITNNQSSYDNSSNSENTNRNTIIVNIRANARDIVADLPQEKRKIAEQVSEIAIDMVEASSSSADSLAKTKIRNKLAELSLLSYRAAESPFMPPKNKVQLMCQNVFKFVYPGQYNKNGDGITYILNSRNTGWINPGNIKQFKENGRQLELIYLEYNKEKQLPVFHYECSSLEES